MKLVETLCKGDPWEKAHCARPKCTTCAPEGGKLGSCRTKNLVYEDICLTCRSMDRSSRYIGESNRTMYLRGLEHVTDVSNPAKVSHIRDHITAEHPELIPQLTKAPHTLFTMQLLYPARSALSRQIREAVEIGVNTTRGLILNNKEEFSRCLIPVLQVDGPGHKKTSSTPKEPKKTQTNTEVQEEEQTALAIPRSRKRNTKSNRQPPKRMKYSSIQTRGEVPGEGVRHGPGQEHQVTGQEQTDHHHDNDTRRHTEPEVTQSPTIMTNVNQDEDEEKIEDDVTQHNMELTHSEITQSPTIVRRLSCDEEEEKREEESQFNTMSMSQPTSSSAEVPLPSKIEFMSQFRRGGGE